MRGNFDYNLIEDIAILAAGDTSVTHRLGRVPVDGFVTFRSAASQVFRGATAWNATTISLRGDANATVDIVLF